MTLALILAGIWLACGIIALAIAIPLCIAAARGDRTIREWQD